MDMIERVAWALRTNKASLSNPEADALARAAIAAMREPTDEMIDAARDNRNYGDNGGLERHDFEQEYKQAIDAVLVTEPAE